MTTKLAACTCDIHKRSDSGISVVYTSRTYDPSVKVTRYVSARTDGMYTWCEQSNNTGYDVRQGVVCGNTLPAHIRVKADNVRGTAFNGVKWDYTADERRIRNAAKKEARDAKTLVSRVRKLRTTR